MLLMLFYDKMKMKGIDSTVSSKIDEGTHSIENHGVQKSLHAYRFVHEGDCM